MEDKQTSFTVEHHLEHVHADGSPFPMQQIGAMSADLSIAEPPSAAGLMTRQASTEYICEECGTRVNLDTVISGSAWAR